VRINDTHWGIALYVHGTRRSIDILRGINPNSTASELTSTYN
jgi:hypothetical protein